MLNYLIVGLGLSGAALARKLELKGRSFKIIDDGKFNSSRVAGGMMNPVILKRFTLAWNADKQLKLAKTFYGDLEKFLKEEIIRPVELYRKFSSVEEQNNWFEAADNKALAPYLDTDIKLELNSSIPASHGFGKVLHARRVDTEKMLDTYSGYLEKNGNLLESSFRHDDLELFEDHIEYQGIKAQHIIFCEGYGIKNNPFFGYLPLNGNKGEYIIIRAPQLKLQETIKSSVFISPAGEDNYAVGATYEHSDKSPEPTFAAREVLEMKLRKLINVPYEVIDQIAGIRPSTADRRPLVGKHPEHANLYCCNGFGSRGVMIAPSVAEDLLALIEEGTELPKEIDLSRFTRKWYKR